jgi:hypothetical protein
MFSAARPWCAGTKYLKPKISPRFELVRRARLRGFGYMTGHCPGTAPALSW